MVTHIKKNSFGNTSNKAASVMRDGTKILAFCAHCEQRLVLKTSKSRFSTNTPKYSALRHYGVRRFCVGSVAAATALKFRSGVAPDLLQQ